MTSPNDFRPTSDWQCLKLRAAMLRRTRALFDDLGMLEVQTPILSSETVIDRHLHPLALPLSLGGATTFYLQTSPEAAMKRLLADAGPDAPSLYQITSAFRGEEVGRLHNPEFTIVEWYQVGEGYQDGMDVTSRLCEVLLDRGPAEGISYEEAFRQHAGIDPHTCALATLRARMEELSVAVPESLDPTDRDSLLDLLLSETVGPYLGRGRPTILFDYPASQSALARTRRDDATGAEVAERFELFVDGIELANGYHELLDADELRRRGDEANRARAVDGNPPLPQPERLLAAMEAGLPSSVGVAMGFDRMVMLAAGASSIRDVLAFPSDRA